MHASIRSLVLVLVLVLALSGATSAGPRMVTLQVDNMYCAACPLIVKESLRKVPGVSQVEVSYPKKTASVTYDDGATTVAALIEATTRLGYPSRVAK